MYLIEFPCCAFLPVFEDVCISEFGERDTAVRRAHFIFFISVGEVGLDEKKIRAVQGECLIIRLTFTDSFPLGVLSVPHS